MADTISRLNRPRCGDDVEHPPTQKDIANALATVQRFARHFSGTDEGRTLVACAKLLSKLDSNPESDTTRQRGYRLRRLRANEPRYAACNGPQTFARTLVDDAKHYLRNRSQYDDEQTRRPLRDPWQSISRIVDLYGGKAPDIDIIVLDLRK